MIITDDNNNNDVDVIDEIECEGMLKISGYRWVPITCRIEVYKETEKAVYGEITVHEDDDTSPVFGPVVKWVPKSMSDNPWFICTVLFETERRVSNKRFDAY